MSRTIELTRGYVTVVDDEDYEYLNQFCWNAQGRNQGRYIYAASRFKTSPVDKFVMMHRLIMGVVECGQALHIDHRNHDTLDNRRENLRVATSSQNQGNGRYSYGRSQYRGVYWDGVRRRWRAQISIANRMRRLGSFESESDAAAAYNEAAVEHFGEFARLNEL